MGLKLDAGDLLGHAARLAIAPDNGIKSLLFNAPLDDLLSDLDGQESKPKWYEAVLGTIRELFTDPENAVKRIWRGICKGVGWLFTKLGAAAGFSFTALWGAITNGAQKLWQFDWNQSDAEIKEQIKQNNQVLAGVWGGMLGNLLGRGAAIAIGYGVGVWMPVIGGTNLARMIASKALLESGEDLFAQFRNALVTTAGTFASNALLRGYMSLRSTTKFYGPRALEWLKKLYPEADTGKAAKILEQWGSKDGPTFSGAKVVEDAVESIKSDWWQSFTESALEEAWEGFVETGFIVAASLDEAWLATKTKNEQRHAIELQPNKDNPHEKFLLIGDEGSLMSTTSTLIAVHQMVQHRDVSTAAPADSEIPATGACLRRLHIWVQPFLLPPFSRPNPPGWKREIKIPNAKQNLTWREIRSALGGEVGYTTGSWLATARLSSGRKICVYADTKESAQTRAEELAGLSEDTVVGLYVGWAAKSELKKKTPYQVYPAYVNVIRLFVDSDGRKFKDGARYREEQRRLPLWTPKAPVGYEGSVFNWYEDDG